VGPVEAPRSGVVVGEDGVARCWWSAADPLYRLYHDTEWGRPVADDHQLFERLSLEAFQSGLSWLTILRKRENFRRAFKSFAIEAVARFNDRSIDRLLGDEGIVRNRAKIEATVNNARRCVDLVAEFGSLGGYVWRFEPDRQSRSVALDWEALVSRSEAAEAKALSKDLNRRGWSFVGATTVYSFMESVGLVNDHMSRCDVRDNVERRRSRFRLPPVRSSGDA
jgi:DNA-3-methyladenine glycosylase I